jgi:hypothetical protein
MKSFFTTMLILCNILGYSQADTHVIITYDTTPCDTTKRLVTINVVDSNNVCYPSQYNFLVDTSFGHIPPFTIPLDTGKHTLMSVVCDGTTFWDTIFISCGANTYINNLNSPNLEIINYPNPVEDNFIIKLNNSFFNNSYLEIMNIIGNNVIGLKLSDNTSKAIINIEGLQNGIYFYRINNDGVTVKTGKILIVK